MGHLNNSNDCCYYAHRINQKKWILISYSKLEKDNAKRDAVPENISYVSSYTSGRREEIV